MKKENDQTKSSGTSPLSFNILLNTFGWRIFPACMGIVTRLPAAFLNIRWLPLCRARENPLRVSAEDACAAVMRGSRAIGYSLHRHFYGGENDVFRLRKAFFIGGHVFKAKRYGVLDVCERLFVRTALRITSLQRGALRKVAVLVFLYNDGKAVRFHASSISQRPAFCTWQAVY